MHQNTNIKQHQKIAVISKPSGYSTKRNKEIRNKIVAEISSGSTHHLVGTSPLM